MASDVKTVFLRAHEYFDHYSRMLSYQSDQKLTLFLVTKRNKITFFFRDREVYIITNRTTLLNGAGEDLRKKFRGNQ